MVRLGIQARSASLDVALLFRQRANGPAIYLAQPAGLGFHADSHLGLKARPLNT